MTDTDLVAEVERLRKRLEREKQARLAAEALAEQGTRQLYERGREMQLLYVVADACGRASSVEEAMQNALDELCAYTGWPIGHAYLVTGDPVRPLKPTNLWHLDHPGHYDDFCEATATMRFASGEGLPGRVLESKAPVWVEDVTVDSNFPRGGKCEQVGVRGAFAIPVLAGKEVVAVLEFFSRETASPSAGWLEIISQVGVQAGRTFEREARHEAERVSRAKSEFLSRMSHELRTPLNAILGFGQLLEMDPLPPGQRDGVQHILKAGRHLLNLINEVLDISRIESGHLHLSLEPVEVASLLDGALNMIRPLAAQAGVTLHAAIGTPGEAYVQADRQRLHQVLLNLLSNAIKYNRRGGRVDVTCVQTDGRMQMRVSDTGAGIPEARLRQLFIPFERLGAEQSSVEGTGLGLALSKRLAEVMRGSMGVESSPGKGSTFWIELALSEAPTAREVATLLGMQMAPVAGPGQHTILYIEDNTSNVQLVERIVALRPDLRLFVAMQARLGIDLAFEHRPDLILLDLNLPDMSGLEVLLLLQNDPRTSAIPVTVISADATRGQVSRLLAAGAAAYLTKPLEVPQFLAMLDKILHPREDARPERRTGLEPVALAEGL